MFIYNRYKLKRWTSRDDDNLKVLQLQRFEARYSYSSTNKISTNFSFQIPVWIYFADDILLIVPQKLNFFQSLFVYLVPLLLTSDANKYSSFANSAYIVRPEEMKMGDKCAITFSYRLSGPIKADSRGHLAMLHPKDLEKIRRNYFDPSA